MIVVGEANAARTAQDVEVFELLDGASTSARRDGSGMSRAWLAMLPATTHYDIFSSPALALAVTQFLDAPMPEVR